MSYKLLIVESPAKAKTIEKYLKDLGNYKVTASVGHVRDIPKSSKKAIDIEAGFVPHYETLPGKEKIIKDIKELASKAEEVLLATDPDREGEAIAWHLAEAMKLKDPKRVVFNEITEEAIKKAVQNPRKIDLNLKVAQEARRVLDRIVGYDLSGLIWKKVRYGLSAGRVQSPALRIIMEREREIRKFKPESFWVITADVSEGKKEAFMITCVEEPRDKTEVDRILSVGKNGTWKVRDVKETKAKRSPKAPFITSTLQQTASTRLGYSPAKTMQIAQKLYEQGHITYMRTDSTTLSKNAQDQIRTFVIKKFGNELYESRHYGKKSKGAQEAHEAVRPTNFHSTKSGNTIEQRNLYSLIHSRTVASQMVDAQVLRTKVLVSVNDGETPDFSINGQRVLEEGWLTADPKARGEDTQVPEVKSDDVLKLLEIKEEGKETQPPNRYTEAGLVKELEKRGIGRPSTYAAIIKTLNDRGYVNKEGKTLIPSDTGDVVSSFLEEHFKDYISDSFTSEIEGQLDEIADGEREYVATIKKVYDSLSKDIAAKEDIPKLTTLGKADKKHKCPKCKGLMEIKLGKIGKFLSCIKYPECDGALTIDGIEIKERAPLGVYPETGQDIYILDGRFGPYVQVGKKDKENKKPKRATLPKDKNPDEVTMPEALKYLSLPKILGQHPKTGNDVIASIGRFGPYVMQDGDFRSLKTDDVYEVKLERAVEILDEPKRKRGFQKKKA